MNGDISNITDMNELKAMAYDAIVIRETADANLRIINGRIEQVKQQAQQEQVTEAQPEGEQN